MLIKAQMLLLVLYVFGPLNGESRDSKRQLRSLNVSSALRVPDACVLPKKVGPCKAGKRRYYFNGAECEQFIYGGCGGNTNNFRTKEACEERCGHTERMDTEKSRGSKRQLRSLNLTSSSEVLDACDYPKKVGPCKAGKRRYYFNGLACEQFIYGGCGANPNNFRTKEACEERCGHRTDTESGEPEVDN